MSDTCIVCLGDLGESASDPLAVGAPRPDLEPDGKAPDTSTKPEELDGNDENIGLIAQLLPCGHILHNDCLKPWVERANSCPICRRTFNVVELSDRVGGKPTFYPSRCLLLFCYFFCSSAKSMSANFF